MICGVLSLDTAQARPDNWVAYCRKTTGGAKLRRGRIKERGIHLARLFEVGSGAVIGWDKSDLAEIFEHQLRSPLLPDLRPSADRIQSLGLAGRSNAGVPLKTFGDLLAHPAPPLPLLQLAKDFAKTADQRADHPLRAEVASALYELTIAAAILRHRTKMTTMAPADLKKGLEWTQQQPWIGIPFRQMAADALALLRQGLTAGKSV